MTFHLNPYDFFEEIRYITEIIIGEYLLFIPSPIQKRSKFLLRICISTPILILSSFFYFLIFKSIADYVGPDGSLGYLRFVFSGWYSFLIILSCLNICFLFDTTGGIIISRCLIAWCFQHLEYAIVNEAMGLGFWKNGRINYLWAYILISIVTCALVFFLMYKIFHKFMKVTDIDKKSKGFTWFYVLFFLILLCITFYCQKIFNAFIKTDIYNAYFAVFVDSLTCVIVLVSQFMIYSLNLSNIQKKEAQLLLAEREKQYEQNREAITIINKKSHDLKHQILALKGMSSDKQDEALKDVYSSISIYDSSFHTGNDVLDTIFTQKKLVAEKKHISITSIIDGTALNFIDKLDLYVLFGNALDNAIEACEKLENREERIISVNIKNVKGFASIQVENNFDGVINAVGDSLSTSKNDKVYHGYGYQSILDIVHKYKGQVVYQVQDQVFILQILIPERV